MIALCRNTPQFEQLFNKSLDNCPSSASCIHKHSSDIQDVNKVYTLHQIFSKNQVHKTGLNSFMNWTDLIHKFTDSISATQFSNRCFLVSSLFHPSAHDLEIDLSQPSWRTCQFSNCTRSRQGMRSEEASSGAWIHGVSWPKPWHSYILHPSH